MKTLQRFCAAIVLTLMLALSTFAGDIHTTIGGPQPAPTPAPMEGEITTGLNGTMHTGVAGDMHTPEATAEEVLAEAVVGLVQGVLALL
jgi:hypothetical protein